MRSERKPFRLGAVVVRPESGELEAPDGARRLEPRVMEVLVCLAEQAGQVVSRDALIQRVWDGRPVVDDVVSRCIRSLRLALGDSRAAPTFVETIPKRGYRLLQPVTPWPPASLPAAALTAQAPRTMAVLPFDNLSGQADLDFIADGLTELLIANLASLGGLRVTSRTSVMRLRSQRNAMPQIAAQLHAELIVEGSVLVSGDKVQVVAQLIDGAADVHLWAEQYQESITNLLDLQNRITRAIAREIQVTLSSADAQRLGRSDPVVATAMKAYLRGQWFISRRTAGDCDQAVAALELAVAEAPTFAKAWAALADACAIGALYGGGPPAPAMIRAGECSQRALELDPDLADAHCSQGVRRLFFDWDLQGARACLRQALARNPSHAIAHVALGDAELAEGYFDQALQRIDAALEISPLDIGINMNRGDFLITAGRFAEAVVQLKQLLAMDEAYWPARMRLAHALARLGRLGEAEALLDGPTSGASKAKLLETRALVAGLAGDGERATQAATELEHIASQDYVSPWLLACAHAASGNDEAVFTWLDRCIDERSPSMIFVRVNAALRPWHADKRFARVLERMREPATPRT